MGVTVTPTSKPETALDNLLNNVDVLATIFDFLKVKQGMEAQERLETRMTLLSAARCCKAFTEPALDVLWRVLPSMLPLLRLLPSFMVYEKVHIINEIEATDWQLYDRHAKRVRELMFEAPPKSIADVQVSPLVYVQLVRMRSSKALLPSLRAIEVPPAVAVEPTLLFHLLSPHTTDIKFNDDASKYSRQFIPSLLATLQISSPHIRDLVLKGPSNINLDPVTGLKSLFSLELDFPETYLFPSFIQSLGHLESLCVLHLHVGLANPTSPPIQRKVRHGKQDSVTHLFPSLGYLNIHGHPSLVARVVDNIELANIRAFIVNEEETVDNSVTTNAWQLIFSRLVGAPYLNSIYIKQCKSRRWGHPDYSISSPLLLQLTDFPCARTLDTIVIENAAISMGDADLATLTSVLKNLDTFELPVETYETSPTIASILHIAKACPSLKTLQLPISSDVDAYIKVIEVHLPCSSTNEHPLMELVMSDGLYKDILKKPEQMIVFAEFFHGLFPNLTFLGDWISVEKMVLALRRARLAGTSKAIKAITPAIESRT